MFMGGVDFATADNVIVGVSLAYEDADVDTAFSNDPTGVVVNYGAASSNGYTIAPYVGIVLDDTWNIDISGGVSSIDTDQNRNNGTITSSVDTDRLFASVNLNGFKQIDRWFVTGRVGALYAESEDDQYTESNGAVVAGRKNKLSQFQLGGEAAYEMGEWEPYIGGTYRYDMTATNTELTNTGVAGDQPSNDDSDFMLSAGVRFYSKEGLTMSLGYDKLYGRDDYDEETVMFNARWDF
jgi:outer membrane autotransporter protein